MAWSRLRNTQEGLLDAFSKVWYLLDVLVLPLDLKLLFTGLKYVKVAAFAEHGEQWLLKVPASLFP